jgi:hypothetical protein
LLAIGAPWLARLDHWIGASLSWIGLALVLTAAVLVDPAGFPGYAVAVPVAGAALAVAGGTSVSGRGAASVLRVEPFQWLGARSYSIYLWHWPVLVIAAAWAGRDLAVWENLVLAGGSVLLAAATYSLLEHPIRDSGFLKGRPNWVSLGMGATLVAASLAIAVGVARLHQLPPETGDILGAAVELPNLTAVERAVNEGVSAKAYPPQPKRAPNPAYSKACNVTRADTTSSVCVHGDQSGSKKAVVLGDSHAAMWIPALDLAGKQTDWQVIQLTKPACPAPDFPIYSGTLKREYNECDAYREFALERIEMIKPDLVIISSAFKDIQRSVDGKATKDGVDTAWAEGLTAVIQRLQPVSGRIVVLGDMAYPEEPGIDCMTAHADDVSACNTPVNEAVYAAHNAMEEQVTTRNGAEYVSVLPWLCTETVCPALVNNLPTHRDAYHIGENYVLWLSEVVARSVGMLPDGQSLHPPSPTS